MAKRTQGPRRKAGRGRKGAPARPASGGAFASLVAVAAFVAVAIGSLRHRPPRPARAATTGSLATVTDEADHKPPPAWLRRIDAWQRGHGWAAFPLAVVKKFSDDRAGYLAALVSYFAFFSLFPLLMALTSILGLVLEGRDEWKDELTGEATEQIPVIGDQLSVGELTGSTVAIVVGVALALWSGLKVIDAAQNALNDVWDVPMVGRPKFAKRRAKSVVLLGVVGLSLIASLASSSLASFLPDLPGSGRFGVFALTVVFNIGVFLLAFKLLSELDHRWGELLPGSVFAAVGWFILQAPGAFYIQRTIDNSQETYREFATVIGLLTFFFLASQVVILGAEINVVRARHLWPRSLLARYGVLTDADRQVLADAADATRKLPDQRVQVAFDPPPGDG
jgi:YihY family inner membrane protein